MSKELEDRIGQDQLEGEGLVDELRRGQAALAAGDLDGASDCLTRACELAQAQDKEIPEASARGMLAQVCLELDRREEAGAHARRALEIAEKHGHEEASQDFRGLLSAAEASPESHALAKAMHQATTSLGKGKAEAALAPLHDALRLAQEQSHEVAEALVRGLFAEAYLRLDKREEAEQNAVQALEISRRRGDDAGARHFSELIDSLEKKV